MNLDRRAFLGSLLGGAALALLPRGPDPETTRPALVAAGDEIADRDLDYAMDPEGFAGYYRVTGITETRLTLATHSSNTGGCWNVGDWVTFQDGRRARITSVGSSHFCHASPESYAFKDSPCGWTKRDSRPFRPGRAPRFDYPAFVRSLLS
jgi:hypothetical protein